MKSGYVYIESGTRFGKLTLLESALRSTHHVLCLCDCGKEKQLRANILKNDGVVSCGCTRRHGLRWTRIYNIHRKMLERCYNENHVAYHRYGGRGIDVCPEWHDVVKFYEDMGDPPDGYQIDRIDNDQGYRKDNCRWVTPKENCNNKSNSKKGKKI
jgi:hypothetical protein